jgi:hypothetical protein
VASVNFKRAASQGPPESRFTLFWQIKAHPDEVVSDAFTDFGERITTSKHEVDRFDGECLSGIGRAIKYV